MPDSFDAVADLPESTPILVGVGQAAERIDDPDYAALGEADLAARAVTAALADTGADTAALAARVDVVAAIRSFEKSSPASSSPLGRPDNMPRAVAARTGMDPRRAIEEVTGGQSPQHLVTEFAGEIAAGRASAVVLFGAEVMSTVRHALAGDGPRPDFAEHVDGSLEDRGFGIKGITSVEEVRHGLITPVAAYALMENARRHRVGQSRDEYATAMGELFAPMSAIAADNPYSAAPQAYSADELVTPSERNRVVAVPYPRRLVARDQVNQAAAVVLTDVATARATGIDSARWTFLHGHADTVEQPLMDREDLSRGPASTAAVEHALATAGVGVDDLDCLDLYSCFPIAVSNICEAFGLSADDPRGLTVTGGLPYFGGPGNNYSMHAIAEIVDRVRRKPGTFGLVAANGGVMSKYSAGVYSTTPAPWRASSSAAVQSALDARPSVRLCRYPDGPAVIETYTVVEPDRERRSGVVLGRRPDGSRFIGTVHRDDEAMFAHLLTSDDPIGTTIYVRSTPRRNLVTLDEAAADRLAPRRAPGFRDGYEHVELRRDGRVLEVTINRPEARNALNSKTNAELDEIFDAYFADDGLWVAILTGAGDKAFSSGNDLAAGPSGALAVPANGFGGLTSRRELPKPVIAAVNGYALGGGLEVALSCHLIVADETASFGLPEVKVGLAAAAGGLVRLPRAVSPALARDMILTGRRLSASEALDAGLVSRVATKGELMSLAREVAAQVLAASPSAVRASIATMASADAQPDTVTAVRDSISVLDEVLVSQDTAEGIMAFLGKREPRWTGH
ncbi:MAG: acetyl-CoA acetyltransferase [Gordonia sp. (in: high G+C Gram-positive bacteria)]